MAKRKRHLYSVVLGYYHSLALNCLTYQCARNVTSLDETEATQLDEQLQQLPHYRAETFLQLEARVEEAQVYTLQCLVGTLELKTRLSLGGVRQQLVLMCVLYWLISVIFDILASKFDDSEFIMAVVETRHSRQF